MDSEGILRSNIFGKTQQRKHSVNLGIFKRLGIEMRKRTRPSEVGSKKASTSTIGVSKQLPSQSGGLMNEKPEV